MYMEYAYNIKQVYIIKVTTLNFNSNLLINKLQSHKVHFKDLTYKLYNNTKNYTKLINQGLSRCLPWPLLLMRKQLKSIMKIKNLVRVFELIQYSV